MTILAHRGDPLESLKCDYDRDGNRLSKQNLLKPEDSEIMTSFKRGTLSDTNSDGKFDMVAAVRHSKMRTSNALLGTIAVGG